VLPALTDGEAGLEALVARAASVGVRRLASQLLFLRSPTKEKYLRWLAAEFPRYLEAYRQAYDGRVCLGDATGPHPRARGAAPAHGLGSELNASAGHRCTRRPDSLPLRLKEPVRHFSTAMTIPRTVG
jgi:hypothetical protein